MLTLVATGSRRPSAQLTQDTLSRASGNEIADWGRLPYFSRDEVTLKVIDLARVFPSSKSRNAHFAGYNGPRTQLSREQLSVSLLS
jgi:hypothetical protein